MAFMLEKGEKCSMCGSAAWEWDPEQGGSRFAYEAVEEQCPGCLRRASAQEISGNTPGTSIKLVPTNTIEHIKRSKKAEQRWREEMKEKTGR